MFSFSSRIKCNEMERNTTVPHKTQRQVVLQKTHNTKHMQGWGGMGGQPHTQNSRPLKPVFTKQLVLQKRLCFRGAIYFFYEDCY